MLWLWKNKYKTNDVDLEDVIQTTLNWYQVTDPSERAWFAMALRLWLPELIKQGRVG